MNANIVNEPVVTVRPALRRISWQAVFGGLIISLAVQLLLTILGVSIGVSVVNPFTSENAAQGAGIESGIWLIVTSIISLGIGGWVAGRLSGLERASEGALQGFVTWGTATVATVLFLSVPAGGILGGTARLLSSIVPAASQMTSDPFQEGLNGQQQAMNTPVQNAVTNAWASIRDEARSIMHKSRLTPTGRTDTSTETNQTAESPQLMNALDRMFSHGQNINPQDRQAAIDALAAQGNMNRDQAAETVDRWIQNYQQTGTQPTQATAQTQTADRAVTMAGWWSFIVLLLGAIAAAGGGSAGARAYFRSRVEVPVAAA